MTREYKIEGERSYVYIPMTELNVLELFYAILLVSAIGERS